MTTHIIIMVSWRNKKNINIFGWKKKKHLICIYATSVPFWCKLTLKAPRKTASENVVCLCRLLNMLADFSNLFLHTGKQCGPRLDCSWLSLCNGYTSKVDTLEHDYNAFLYNVENVIMRSICGSHFLVQFFFPNFESFALYPVTFLPASPASYAYNLVSGTHKIYSCES